MIEEITSKVYSLIVGGLFMLVIYHIILFAQHRKKLYLYYSLYMFFLSLYVFATNYKDVLGPDLLSYNGLFLLISFAFYFLLVRDVLNTSKNHPVLDDLIKYGALILLIVGPFFPVIAFSIGYDVYVRVYDVFAVFLTVYSLIIYRYIFKVKTRYSYYLITGSLFYFICSMIVLFWGIFIGSQVFKDLFGFPLLLISYSGILLEALIFASLIGFKTKEVELEKVRNKANYEIEKQKTATLLKEKEIETINAMVEGQEKERQRLAGDLHDSIGGTLAALKMHLGTMENTIDKKETQKDLLSKANILISDAYTRVRKIAHERNSGVMAKDGLLPAVQRLARNVSNATLAVSVQDFGLEKRLHTDLEITIFRIVQELVTNVIKHAQATKTLISLNEHKEKLNIIIEDNGKGFKVGKLEKKEGMGLGSIKRRVEHLEGNMVVSSRLGKGTHILIDIPL